MNVRSPKSEGLVNSGFGLPNEKSEDGHDKNQGQKSRKDDA
jgi:hypothetical protein